MECSQSGAPGAPCRGPFAPFGQPIKGPSGLPLPGPPPGPLDGLPEGWKVFLFLDPKFSISDQNSAKQGHHLCRGDNTPSPPGRQLGKNKTDWLIGPLIKDVLKDWLILRKKIVHGKIILPQFVIYKTVTLLSVYFRVFSILYENLPFLSSYPFTGCPTGAKAVIQLEEAETSIFFLEMLDPAFLAFL